MIEMGLLSPGAVHNPYSMFNQHEIPVVNIPIMRMLIRRCSICLYMLKISLGFFQGLSSVDSMRGVDKRFSANFFSR